MDNQQQNFNNQIIEEYLNGVSANELAKKFNKNISSIMYLLRKNNINIRSIGENVTNYHIKNSPERYNLMLTQLQKEFVIGLLLGDGSLRVSKTAKMPYYIHTDKNLEYIEFLKKEFELIGISCGNIRLSKYNNCYSFQTKSYMCFQEIYDIFYPNKKRILPDIKITSTILKYWYIGDGSLCKQQQTNRKRISIACIHFNNYILNQLKELFGSNCNYYKSFHYHIPSTHVVKFLNFIGNCPVECYKYKWLLEDVQRL